MVRLLPPYPEKHTLHLGSSAVGSFCVAHLQRLDDQLLSCALHPMYIVFRVIKPGCAGVRGQ